GYHFLLDQTGRVYQGRPFLDESIKFEDGPPLALGAHVGGANTGNIGVSVLGCYHPPEGGGCRDVLSSSALDSLVTLFAYLSETYGVSPSILRGHRDYSSTACPGDNNYQLIPVIKRRMAELLETGNRPVGTANLVAVVNTDGVVSVDWQFLTDLGITQFRVDRVSAAGRQVIFSGDSALDMSVTDDEITSPGEVRYELLASNADGRVQLLASARVEIEHPLDFVLSSSFPNPFFQVSTVRYFLAEDGFVTLRVFDAAGRQVDELQDGFQEKDRWYTAHFDAGDLSSGTYFYRITVDGFAGVVFDESGTLVLAR
ncbi:MAG TPA: N-acetylmuramoyl-L-alanine amidase, partial [Rhodothermia bacterium]